MKLLQPFYETSFKCCVGVKTVWKDSRVSYSEFKQELCLRYCSCLFMVVKKRSFLVGGSVFPSPETGVFRVNWVGWSEISTVVLKAGKQEIMNNFKT